MDPIAALERAIYLLDRERAPRQKVQAFVKAKAAAIEVGPEEIAKRAAEGSLTDIPGIGKSTAAVISEALDGTDDGYLAALDERTAVPAGVGADLRAAIKGDCHMHSNWSDGGASLDTMVRTARAIGHDYVVATDHSARLTVAHGLNEERLAEQLDEVAALNEQLAPFRVLSGMEVDIFEDGTLDLADDMLARLDVVVASVHSKMRLPKDAMTKRCLLYTSPSPRDRG